jgi:uncharacterized RDD family membrane protein YckC
MTGQAKVDGRKRPGLFRRVITKPVRALGDLEAAAATPVAEKAVDSMLAGPLPEMIGKSIGENRVIERVVAEVVANSDLEQAVVSALESERTARLVEEILASPALERLIREALESKLTAGLADGVLQSAEFEQMLGRVMSSPEVRHALTRQSTSLAAETAAGLRRQSVRADVAAERLPRRWFRRAPRAETRYGGVASRALALVADAALATFILVVGSALVGLVASLVGHLEPKWLVGAIVGSAWLLLLVVYFVGFWAAAGQTPGMRLMHLRVVTHANAAPSVARSTIRFVALLLSIVPCFAGFLPALVDDRRRGLPDFVAGTVVLYDEQTDAAPVVDRATAARGAAVAH